MAEVGDSSGTQKKGNICCLKPPLSDGSEDVTVDISVRNSELLSVVTLCINGLNRSGHQCKARL
jgi:hypothetical protein